MMKFVSLMLIVSMVALSGLPRAKAAMTCNSVTTNLTPCISYVLGGGAVPAACCNGVKTIYNAAQTPADRQTVCRCIKSAVGGTQYSSYNLGLAAGLPDKCGVNIPYKISPSTDCNTVQ